MEPLGKFWSDFFLDETDDITKLNLFGPAHIFLLLMTIALAVLLYWKRDDIKRWKYRQSVRYVMAGVFFVNMLLLYTYFILTGVYTWKLHLPLHLCFISGYLLCFVLVTGNRKLFGSGLFFYLDCPLPAMLWPNTPMRIDRFLSWHFVISHHILLLTGLYCLFVLEYKIEKKSMIKAFVLGNIIFVFVFAFNKVFGTNYIMTDTLPPHILQLFPFLKYFNIPILWLELCGIAMMLRLICRLFVSCILIKKEGCNISCKHLLYVTLKCRTPKFRRLLTLESSQPFIPRRKESEKWKLAKTEVQARIKSTSKKQRLPIIMLGVFCVILAALLAVSFLYINKLRNQSVSAMSKIEQQQKTMEEDMIPLDVFKQHSNQYSVGIPFLQSFFDDVIVYKNDTGVVYEPVDDSLPKTTTISAY